MKWPTFQIWLEAIKRDKLTTFHRDPSDRVSRGRWFPVWPLHDTSPRFLWSWERNCRPFFFIRHAMFKSQLLLSKSCGTLLLQSLVLPIRIIPMYTNHQSMKISVKFDSYSSKAKRCSIMNTNLFIQISLLKSFNQISTFWHSIRKWLWQDHHIVKMFYSVLPGFNHISDFDNFTEGSFA